MYKLVLAILVILMLPSVGGTTDYYVSNAGTDCAYPTCGIIGNPFETAQYAADAVSAGDTVYFNRGDTFTGGLYLHTDGEDPESGNGYITFSAYGTGADPIITGSASYGGDTTPGNQIEIEANWNIVEHLYVTGYSGSKDGIHIGDDDRVKTNIGDYNIIRNCELDDVGEGMVVRGSHNSITNNYIHDFHMVVNTPGGDDDYGCTAFKVGSYDGKNVTNNDISYNIVEDSECPSYDYGTDGGGLEMWLQGGTTSDIYFHHNYLNNSKGCSENGSGQADVSTLNNVKIYHNIFVNTVSSIAIHRGSSTFAIDNFGSYYFENNTFIETENGINLLYRAWGGNWDSNTHVRNNIFYTNINGGIISTTQNQADRAEAGDLTYNFYYLPNRSGSDYYTLDATETGTSTDPLFNNVSGNDLHLQSNSTAISAGINLGYSIDYDGVSIPQGAGYDMGAYEYEEITSFFTGATPSGGSYQ